MKLDHDMTKFKASSKSILFHATFIESIKFRKQDKEGGREIQKKLMVCYQSIDVSFIFVIYSSK